MIKSRLNNLNSFDAYMFKYNVNHVYKINVQYAQIIENIKKDNCLISARHTRHSELIKID